MASKWVNTTLGNLIKTNQFNYSKNDNWEFVHYLDTGNITENNISVIQYLEVGKDKIPSRAKRKVAVGDIIYSTVRPDQKHYGIIKNPPKNLLVSTGFTTISCNEELADNNFIYWFLTQEYITNHLHRVGEQSASTYPSIKPSDIEALEISLPSLSEQKAIAHILGKLGEKIELNRKMNETLEAMAQTLFKSWFVDFDPVIDKALLAGNAIPDELTERAELRQAQLDKGKTNTNSEITDLFPSEFKFTEEFGWIPKGWSVSTLGNESDFSNGYAFKSKELSNEKYDSYHVFKMGHIKRGGGFNPDGTKSYYPKANSSNLERYLLEKGDILMAMTDMKSSMALLGHTALMPVNNKYLLNQRVGKLRVINKSTLNYPYIYIYSNLETTIEEIRSRSNSGVQVNLSTSEIKATPILVPNKEAHDLFDRVALDLFNKIFANDNSSASLTKLRDSLLPKLMSGELRIADAEKLVEDI